MLSVMVSVSLFCFRLLRYLWTIVVCNVYVVHACFDLCVYGAGVCVNVCGVVCVVECCLFLESGLLCCVVSVWGVVKFVLYVMSVVS